VETGGAAHGIQSIPPLDSRPAEDSTQVLVFYAPDAIYFGIRAFEKHGNVVRATLADRDNIGADDNVQILLDTFNDRRRALLFAVNRWARNRTAFAVRGLPAPQAGEMRAAALTASSISTRLHLRIAGPSNPQWLRGRGPHSVQEPALPGRCDSGLGHPDCSGDAAHRL